jgi:signal peptidase I
MTTVASEAKATAQARREAELVAAADKGPRAFYQTAGYGRLASIVGGAIAIALVAQHLIRRQEFLVGSLAAFFAVFLLSTIGSATPWGVRSRARTEARNLRRSALRLLKRNRARISESSVNDMQARIRDVDEALQQKHVGTPALQARLALDAAIDRHLGFARKSAAREYTESIGGAILIALLLRAFVFEPFHIPSGSMIPTLLVGDFIFVNKMSYGLRIPFTDPSKVHKIWESPPKRGDVVVFKNPAHPDIDYVKRVVGVPGDHIEIRDNVLFVNGVEQPQQPDGEYVYKEHSDYTDSDVEVTTSEFVETLDGHPHKIIVRKDNAYPRNGSFVVEPGRLFMMGDNRDNSQDSRIEGGPGQVPFSYILGKATFIWISFGGSNVIRFDRLFRSVK